MLTVLTDGDTFRYRTPDGNVGTIFVGGNPGSTQLEVVGATVNPANGAFTITNLPGSINGAPVNGGLQATVSLFNYVFEIYVVKSDSSSFLAAEEFLAPDNNPVADTLAFVGAAAPINFMGIGLTNRATIAPPAGSGPLLLGALSISATVTLNALPITTGTAPAGTFTLTPNGGGGTFNAGVVVANANDFGNFLWGGTFLGTADFTASVNEFYAGWLIAGSVYYGGTAFTVAGDCGAILSTGAIGTDNAILEAPALLNTDFELSVGGRLGEVRTSADFMGGITVNGSSLIPGSGASSFGTQSEVESRGGDGFPGGNLGEAPVSENDTLTTPEILPVSAAGTATVNGSLNIDFVRPTNDDTDTYGVAMLAGQTFTTQLTANDFVVLHVAVYDPDGVLIATDYNATDSTFTTNQPFQITAQKPGLYRFVVAQAGNPLFTTGGGGLRTSGFYPYQLAVSGIGNVSFGGVLAQNIVRSDIVGFTDNSGDIGAVLAVGGALRSTDLTFTTLNGNLREAQGASVGFISGGLGIIDGITLAISGSVGLVEASGGVLALFTATPVGGNIQVISAISGNAGMNIAVDGGIGVIRAASLSTSPASTIQVNADSTPNNDGVIDLIDVTGNFGTLGDGGPHIITGPGGDVRYLHVGGTVFEDSFFGGGSPSFTTFQPGESTTIVDDSGTVVTLAPNSGLIADPANAGQFITTPGTLTVTTYGIEGSGGSAIVNVTSTHGVTVTVDGNTPGQSAEIGTITVQGLGTALIPTPPPPPPPPGTVVTGANGGNGTSGSTGNGTQSIGGGGTAGGVIFPAPGQPGGAPVKTGVTGQPTNTPVTLPPLPEFSTVAGSGPLDVILNGNAKADVYSITGTDLTSIQNNTPGEIVGGSAISVGTLSANGSIGVPVGTFGEQVNGASTFSNTYPFNQQHYGFVTSGVNSGMITIKAPKLGNIVAGTLGVASITGAIDGVVQVNGPLGTANLTGMTWEGRGNVALSGIFATNTVGTVTSTGDIRGDLVSESGFQKIQLTNNASLIDAQIGVYANFTSASPLLAKTLVSVVSPITNPILQVGSVSATGTGGIIGTAIIADHVGTVSASGYGIFDSFVNTAGDGTLFAEAAAGYGIRFGFVFGGTSVGSIVAVGNGRTIPVTNYPADVRQSEGGGMFDPNTGLIFSPINDIDTALGASVATPAIVGVTDSGIIEDLTVTVDRNVGTISAYAIRERMITVDGVPFSVPSAFDVANSIGTLQTAGGISTTSITTGRIGTFRANGDTSNDTIQVAGSIGSLVFKSNLDGGSSISVSGPNGHIGSITVDGNLAGSISAKTFIQNIHVLGSITGSVSAGKIGTIHVHSGLANGGLTVNGPITNLIFDGDGGNTGDTITINGNSTLVKVAGNLAASLNVTGNLGQLLVGGSILSGSNVTIGNVLNLLRLGADLQAGATLSAHLIKRQIIKGQVFGTITIT
jgi:hypothetical protein